MRRTWFLSVLIVILAAPPAIADGQRQGFIIGAGVGVSPISTISGEHRGYSYDELEVGFAVNVLIGFAWNEHNMLVWEGNGSTHGTKHLREGSVLQGFYGPTWYHYYGETGSGWFTLGGVGWYQYEDTATVRIRICFNCGEEPPPPLPREDGLGFLVGGGYEFARHYQLSASLGAGRTSGALEWTHVQLGIFLTAVSY